MRSASRFCDIALTQPTRRGACTKKQAPRRVSFALQAAVAFLALLCAGCAARDSNALAPAIRVEIPIERPVYCVSASPARPELALAKLRDDSPPADTIRAYAATVATLKGAVAERDAIIAGCASPAQENSLK